MDKIHVKFNNGTLNATKWGAKTETEFIEFWKRKYKDTSKFKRMNDEQQTDYLKKGYALCKEAIKPATKAAPAVPEAKGQTKGQGDK